MAKKEKKQYTLDRKKFLLFVTIFVIIIAIIIIIIALNKNVEINEATDISNLNASKYYDQIFEMYNSDESKDKFIIEYNNIQNQIGMYIINNSTKESDSFNSLVNNVNKKLEKKEFKSFEVENPTFWNGTWSVDEKAKLKFKFENKKIEPDWINDKEVEGMILKN